MQPVTAKKPIVQFASSARGKPGIVFSVFCIWTFVFLCRPQDIFPVLAVVRPALATSVLMVLTALFHLEELQRNRFFTETQVKLYAALVVLMVAGIPTSLYAGRSFEVVFTSYINVVLFVFIFFKLVDSVEKISRVLLIACLGNGLYSAFALATGNYAYGRLYFGSMFDPNDLSFFAISFMPLNLVFIKRDHPLWIRMACLGSFGLGLLLILLTGSRGGLVALVGVSVLLLFTRSRVLKSGMKTLLVLVGVAFTALAPINWERYETLLKIEEDYNLYDETGRMVIWKIGMQAMLERPITGTGVETFYMAVGKDRERRNLPSQAWQAAHNMAVQIGTETGVIGLALFLLMSVNVFRIFFKVRAKSSSETLVRISEMGNAGFLGLFISGMFLSQAYSLYWAFYIVLSAAVNRVFLNEMR
jgi:O-antigen ligase